MKPLFYTAAPIKVPPSIAPEPEAQPIGSPIRMAVKHKGCHWLQNVFSNDRGFPNQSDEYDMLLHNIDGGLIPRKLKHPPPPLNVANLKFLFPFDKALHGERLCEQLNLSHLDPSTQLAGTDLVKKYWSVFDKPWVWVPVRIMSVLLTPVMPTQLQ